jgi:GNAT superfamily N-acetyltransferase
MTDQTSQADAQQPEFTITSLTEGTLQAQGAFLLFGKMRDEVISHQPAVADAFDHSLGKGLSLYEGERANLWIVMADELPAACLGVTPLRVDSCELKRLFVQPQYRGMGLSRQLLERAIIFAKTAQYRAIYLDTLWQFRTAQQLYKAYGFEQIQPYNTISADIACHMMLRL